jgi:hypothetical protein
MHNSCTLYAQCILHNTIDLINLNLEDLTTLNHLGEVTMENVDEITSLRTLVFEYRESCFIKHHLNTCKWSFDDLLDRSTQERDCVCSYITEKCKNVDKFFANKKKKLLRVRQLRQMEEKKKAGGGFCPQCVIFDKNDLYSTTLTLKGTHSCL